MAAPTLPVQLNDLEQRLKIYTSTSNVDVLSEWNISYKSCTLGRRQRVQYKLVR